MKPFATSSNLSERIIVQVKSDTPTQYGALIWNDFLKIWAGIKSRIGSEALVNTQNKRVSTSRTTFTVRRTSQTESITPAMRILWRGNPYGILSIIETDDRAFLQIEAERKY